MWCSGVAKRVGGGSAVRAGNGVAHVDSKGAKGTSLTSVAVRIER